MSQRKAQALARTALGTLARCEDEVAKLQAELRVAMAALDGAKQAAALCLLRAPHSRLGKTFLAALGGKR